MATITRVGYCKSNPRSNTSCNGLSASECKAKGSCIWIPSTKIKDVGAKGKTPKSKKWAPKAEKGKLGSFFQGGKVIYEENACKLAGKEMKKSGIPLKELTSMFNYFINLNKGRKSQTWTAKAMDCRNAAKEGFLAKK